MLDLHAALPVGVELRTRRYEHAKRRVPALTIVEDLEVLEDRRGQFDAGVPPFAVEQLDLHP
jgi:hypothetical protein